MGTGRGPLVPPVGWGESLVRHRGCTCWVSPGNSSGFRGPRPQLSPLCSVGTDTGQVTQLGVTPAATLPEKKLLGEIGRMLAVQTEMFPARRGCFQSKWGYLLNGVLFSDPKCFAGMISGVFVYQTPLSLTGLRQLLWRAAAQHQTLLLSQQLCLKT